MSGVMVALVPKDPETDPERFRRDQSDMDGGLRVSQHSAGIVHASLPLKMRGIFRGWSPGRSRATCNMVRI